MIFLNKADINLRSGCTEKAYSLPVNEKEGSSSDGTENFGGVSGRLKRVL